ncbi:TPA: hypothetical protein EYN98_19055 [Candidatus Poribacteria bacterium]|nr:hypothetical protein [Candidatus Poribacteria bacterium]HIB99841.1 hypothetical protein [Candidatus Poribacteria bacterium]
MFHHIADEHLHTALRKTNIAVGPFDIVSRLTITGGSGKNYKHSQAKTYSSEEVTPGLPANLRLCQQKEWNDRMVLEAVLSMPIFVYGITKIIHCARTYFKTWVGLTMALFNIMLQWDGLPSLRTLALFHFR